MGKREGVQGLCEIGPSRVNKPPRLFFQMMGVLNWIYLQFGFTVDPDDDDVISA